MPRVRRKRGHKKSRPERKRNSKFRLLKLNNLKNVYKNSWWTVSKILKLPQNGKIALFQSRQYKEIMTFGLRSSNLCLIVCVYDPAAGANQTRADFLFPSWLGNICQSDMTEIRMTSDPIQTVSGSSTLRLKIDESRTRVKFGEVDKLVVSIVATDAFYWPILILWSTIVVHTNGGTASLTTV